MIGQTVSHYRIVEKLGEGGMGVLYRAIDTRLDRPVAMKFLRPEAVGSPERRQRFIREAKAASALNHPHIITVHDIGRTTVDGQQHDFIVMEYVDGKSLGESIGGKALDARHAVAYASQIAEAVAAAHEAGIVHRDIKPANIMITDKGQVKVVDFGLAKLLEPGEVDASATTYTAGLETEEGVVLGTAAYMSPEQAEGKPSDARSDVFSLGVVLYEMLTGRRPFQGDSHVSTRMAILHEEPPPLKSVEASVPPELERTVLRCLEKRKEDRPSASDVMRALVGYRADQSSLRARLVTRLRRPHLAVPAALLLVSAIAAMVWLSARSARVRWARNEALPEIERLITEYKNTQAFRLALEAERYLPGDPELERLMDACTISSTLETEPPGATVRVKAYARPEEEWIELSVTPLEEVRVPAGYLRAEITKEGFQTLERAFHLYGGTMSFDLTPLEEVPAGMVRVRETTVSLADTERVPMDSFWIDRFEVTNAKFERFVDAGGYAEPELWKEPFVRDGQTLSFDEAMSELRDRTGRPGPATWELSSFAEGEGDLPVHGVSWYEAAAYCEFMGKTLPTVHHWTRAGGQDIFSDILAFSNFSGEAPAPVGSYQGLSPYGSYDMAGNVAEWCSNATGDRRYIAGASWKDVPYRFMAEVALDPFDRTETNGFRCVRYEADPDPRLTAPIRTLVYDYSQLKPADDDLFQVYRRNYEYDPLELNTVIEFVDDSRQYWRKETVSFDAPYGDERIVAHLFLPRNASPPYQTLLFFPSSAGLFLSTIEPELAFIDFIPKSGRALMYPVYQEMYQRRHGRYFRGPQSRRDTWIHWVQEMMRSFDYLETRDDIDPEKFAVAGLSLGLRVVSLTTALDTRVRSAILIGGGFGQSNLTYPPEIANHHFVSRIHVPTLMITGRYDMGQPYETAQVPMFRMLAAPEGQKRLAAFESGHLPPKADIIRETLGWLDAHLGPVELK